MPGTRKLGRASDHRDAMLRNMVTSLLENGKMTTTVTRAKEVRAMTEKMITLAKVDSLHNKRQALAYITKDRFLTPAGMDSFDLKFFFSPLAHFPAFMDAVPISTLFVLSITLILNENLSKSKPELLTTEKL